MPTLTIDGIEVTVDNGVTLMQACEEAGAEIPRFCYHDRLSIAGNCRMCLVEQENAPKPVASCAMPAADGMVIQTNSPSVKKAREGVMEFLLINHPLDCPICDQGGECDLQDQSMAYGGNNSRYDENKRAVTEKNMGPLIKTVMTRCIHCTRCIRFAQEVAGVEEIGALGRGEHMEISTYLEQSMTSELSGNVIDLCPVGALTSKPYAFTARSWELEKTESIDVHDAVGSNIRIDVRGKEVMRILPRLNEDVNQEWLADRSRFAYDGLKKSRLDKPYVRVDGKLTESTWEDAFSTIADKVTGTDGSKIAGIAGDLADVESMTALKDLLTSLGSANLDCRIDGVQYDASNRASYIFNSTINGIDQADALLIVGANIREDAPIINARIRQQSLTGNLQIGVIGENLDLTYDYDYLGAGAQTLVDLVSGTGAFAQTLKDASYPMIIIGQNVLARADGQAIAAMAAQLANEVGAVTADWNGYNVLHQAAGRVGGLDIGFVPQDGGHDIAGILDGAVSGDIEIVFLHHADEIDMSKLQNAFVIYQGSHGDAGVQQADVILPGATYTEKAATWVNTEGRAQRGNRAAFPPGDAREDWTILRALSGVIGKTLPYDTLDALRDRIAEIAPHLAEEGQILPANWQGAGTAGDTTDEPFKGNGTSHYQVNPICRASDTMQECTDVQKEASEETGTNG
jgi:NADH-quinone oxidoreductase subunit G